MPAEVAAGDPAQAFLNLFRKQRQFIEVFYILEHDLAGTRFLIGEDLAVTFDDHQLPLDLLCLS